VNYFRPAARVSGETRKAALNNIRRESEEVFTKTVRKSNKAQRFHHRFPLIGHPANVAEGNKALQKTIFPTGGLPKWIHGHPWNIIVEPSDEAHMAVHRRMIKVEQAARKVVNIPTMAARGALDVYRPLANRTITGYRAVANHARPGAAHGRPK
jgi:hypothetical protein